ncbi:hypothetical protein RJ53_11025 [Methanocalculus chunghsingensis]|uniref:Uncharacterized protein n=1 Tax=Methanocalculus chunghsingensis TaxID=156457 RepID=A0A8J7W916_9EURY|nr:hypothetical protein [Methanocalculus chunghsingensis]MBR1369981.1 hypothetical protein [Methanocalculus chunghsingensis]
MMTVIFSGDPSFVFTEAFLVLGFGGQLIISFIEHDGSVARQCKNEVVKGQFLRYARYLVTDEVSAFYREAGFQKVSIARKASGFFLLTGSKQ